MDRAQRVDEKNGVICLVMFAPGAIVTKVSKMAHFLHFLLITVVFYISFFKRQIFSELRYIERESKTVNRLCYMFAKRLSYT